MQVEGMNSTGTILQQYPRSAESIDSGRKNLEKGQQDLQKSSTSDTNTVQPEEILNRIKSLTDNGLYSVRFENSQEFDQLVVKIVDSKTDEVIHQIPAEEILGMKASLAELSGKIVNTVR